MTATLEPTATNDAPVATFDSLNPANGDLVGTHPVTSKAEVDAAVAQAREAAGWWGALSFDERAEHLLTWRSVITRRIAQLANLSHRETGKPHGDAQLEIILAIDHIAWAAKNAKKVLGPSKVRSGLLMANQASTVEYQPLGVVGVIGPWNYPVFTPMGSIAYALAAGNTVVFKPSEYTPGVGQWLADTFTEVVHGRPVLQVVTGLGETGNALCTADVDKLAFTGSVPTGSKIMATAARDIKNISLELGGKSPFVVFADSDIEKAVEWIMFGIFWNQGQVCSATSRVLVEESLYPRLLDRLVAEAGRITIGNGLDDGVLLGPLVSKSQYDKVLGMIARGKADGATIAHGGKRPAGLDTGFFLEPTILTDMAEDSFIWREEIFAPVVCVKPFRDEADAIRMANDSRFGLAAAVMSKDRARCERVARAFRAGIVWVNCSQPTFTEAPWGGYKQSGIGRELGTWGLSNYLEVKQITAFESDEPWGWYIKP